jgi:hypothetical protein
MDFRTKIPVAKPAFLLSFADRVMVLGSCFAENIGSRLEESGFNSITNPFGVLYNPASISLSIRRMIRNEKFSISELSELDGLYHSFSHHGSFSGSNADNTLKNINNLFEKAVGNLKETNCLIITLGTAWVYALAENGRIVANCHKFPEDRFRRFRLSVEDIVEDYVDLFELLTGKNKDLNIILTVSPIRHLKDGIHENTLSKSVLHLAAEKLCGKFGNAVYYPSYEIMMDDLRDYRFYDEDMMHPSQVAQDYIWDHFSESFMTKSTREIARQVQQIRKAMNHKPLHGTDEPYLRFAQKNIASIEILKLNVPELNLSKEKAFFENILNGSIV